MSFAVSSWTIAWARDGMSAAGMRTEISKEGAVAGGARGAADFAAGDASSSSK
jgi:hypothetical protein